MKILFLDCISGISGDMTVGALCDLGVKPSTLEWELAKLDIGDFHMHFERQQRSIEGIKFGIHEGATHTHEQDEHGHAHDDHGHHHECDHEHGHTHEHPHTHEHEHTHDHPHTHDHGHAHEHSHEHGHEHHHHHEEEHTHEHEHGHEHAHGRSHAEIRVLIGKSDLSEFVKKHALSIFQRVAVAEGKIHGMPPESVTFHEVGALDSIADIVCVCAGIEALGVQKIFASPLFDGRGSIQCAHGTFPLPAPATLEILGAAGVPLSQIDEPYEFITPTGAAILAEFGASFGLMPRMKIEKIGYGIGTRKLANRPNVLRAVLGEAAGEESTSGYETDTITRIETNLDDLPPELLGAVMDKLFGAGALDVFFTPIQMKKNRPATQLTALCEDAAVAKIADVIFSETTSFGLRMDRVNRLKLERKFEKVRTPYGEVTVKLGLKDGHVIQASPEFESVRAASEKSGEALRTVYEATMRAWHSPK